MIIIIASNKANRFIIFLNIIFSIKLELLYFRGKAMTLKVHNQL